MLFKTLRVFAACTFHFMTFSVLKIYRESIAISLLIWIRKVHFGLQLLTLMCLATNCKNTVILELQRIRENIKISRLITFLLPYW